MSANAAPTIRHARPADAPRIAELASQLGYPGSAAVMTPRLARLASAGGAVLVAVDGRDSPIAVAHVITRDSLMSDAQAEIDGIVVDESQRNAGIGAALVAAAERWAADHGCTSVRIRCNAKREAAHRFYARLGYRETKRQIVFDREISAPPRHAI